MIIGLDTEMEGFEHLNTEYTKVTEPTNEEWTAKELQYKEMFEDEEFVKVYIDCQCRWNESSLSFFPKDEVEIKEITDETI